MKNTLRNYLLGLSFLFLFIGLFNGVGISEINVSAAVCTDTDNGNNIYEKGITCRPSTIHDGLFCKTDECVSATSLKEYYCKDDKIFSKTVACEHGCADGACKQSGEYFNYAKFVSQSVPNSMEAGNTYEVSVTMENTGTNIWSSSDNYRLGSQNPQDNFNWGTNRVYLSSTESIDPGDTKTFTFDVVAPSEPGIYNFQWKMLKEHKEWFGEQTENVSVSAQGEIRKITINSFTSDVEPIPGLWTYYTASVTSSISKTVILSLDIYPISNPSHPDRHHGFFNKQVTFSPGETKTVKVRYNWQGKGQYDLGDGWIAANTWKNLSCCGYTDYDVQFLVWENGSIIANKNITQTLKPLDKKVLTYYFYWYDGKTGSGIWCADGINDMLTDDPIYGKGSWFSWQNPDFHKVEFARMKRSGIDIALPVYWGDCTHTCNFGGDCPPEGKWSDYGLDHMVKALDELESEGKDYPLIGMFYDTSANAKQYSLCEKGCSNWPDPKICPYPSLYDPHNKEVFYQMIKDFYTRIPDKYVAKIGGRYIVSLYTAHFFSAVDCSAFDYARDKFKEDFGKELLMVTSRNFGSCDSIEAYGTYAEDILGLPHPPTDRLDICAVTAGYDHLAITKPEYGGCGNREPFVVDRKNGETYIKNWDECIADNEGWIIIDGGWNEFFEGSDIAPSEQYGLEYLELTNQKVGEFKGTAPAWHECESNDECIKDCVKYECVSNKCTSTILNNNVCPKKYDFTISAFDAWYDLLPKEMKTGNTLLIPTEITNNGTELWKQGGDYPVRISYHWKQNGEYIVFDGLRTLLPKDIASGESFIVPMKIKAPDSSGTYTLMIDPVQKGKHWFSNVSGGSKRYEKTVIITDTQQYSFNFSGDIPSSMTSGEIYTIPVALENTGTFVWESQSTNPTDYIALSYHWLGKNNPNQLDGLRTHLPYDLDSGKSVNLDMAIQAPQSPGSYTLIVEPVHEHITWFSGKGAQTKFYDCDVSNIECNSDGTDITGKCSVDCGASAGCDGTDPNSCSANSLKKCDSICQEVSSCEDGDCNCGEDTINCLADCPAVETCTDTDGGENIYEKGTTCRPSEVHEGLFCETDECVSSTSLKEYYCMGEKMMSKIIHCEHGCENGACKQIEDCLNEGETYMPGENKQCCSGLKAMSITQGNGEICTIPTGYVCTAFCGNGKCEGEYENKCSCPQDCKTITPDCRDENYGCSIEDKPCCPGLKESALYGDPNGNCSIVASCGSICIFCGNGVCDAYEGICNCPEDCSEPKPISEMTIAELRAKIAEIVAQIKQLQILLAELQGHPQEVSNIPSDFTFNNNLRLYTRHPDVVYLKIVLEQEIENLSWTRSNYFGPKTLGAVKAFQNKYRQDISKITGYTIRASGFAGPGTRAKLNEILESY